MAEAARLGKIKENPTAKVRKLAEDHKPRGILTPKEAKSFFELAWEDKRVFAANLLAATTGMRLGEIRGLLAEHVHEGWGEVRTIWQDEEGLKAPKWKSIREVPIPKVTEGAFKGLIAENPWGGSFVFYGEREKRPMNDDAIRESFKAGYGQSGSTKSSAKSET